MLFTDQDIARNFDARDNTRGRLYQAEGRVKDIVIERNGAHVEALVHGSAQYPYRVKVEVRKAKARLVVQSECSCPVGYMCKHAAAALYEALAEDNRRHERLKRPHLAMQSREAKASRLSPQLSAWATKLEEEASSGPIGEGDRIVYFLSAHSLGAMPHLSVTPALQHKMRDGSWSRPRPQSFQQIAALNQYNRLLDKQDQAVFDIAALDATSNSQRMASAWLPPTDPEIMDLILRRLIKTGRTYGDENATVPLRLGEPVKASLTWTLLSNGKQKPDVQTEREGVNILLSRAPWYVDPLTGEAGPLQLELDVDKIIHFLSAQAIEEKEAALLRERFKRAKTAVPLPNQVKIGKGKSCPPSPSLKLVQSSPQTAAGDIEAIAFLSFAYAGKPVHPLDPSAHYQEKQEEEVLLYPRQREEESRLLKELDAIGLVATDTKSVDGRDFIDPRGLGLSPAVGSSPWFWLDFIYEVAPRLQKNGFSVSIDPSFKMEILEPDTDDIDAAFTQNGEWWFSLDLGISVGGERVKLLPLLVSLIRRLKSFEEIDHLTNASKCYIPLPDGRQVALPAERIQTILKTLVELFDPKALDQNDQLRVSMDLAAAFIKLEAITRKRWLGEGHLRKLVEKLGDFDGIRHVALPKGLKAELRHYQMDGTNWLHFLGHYGLSGILADDMGLGKTIQALAYIQSLKERDALDGPCLIVMPTSLVANWQSETTRFTPELKTLTLHGRERLKRYTQITKADIVFTTYPLLPRDQEVLSKVNWSLLILDEAQAIKNPTAKMTQAACSLQAKQRLCLTGTPVENHLGEAWSLFTFLMPGLLGDHKNFAKHYRTPIEKGGDAERKDLLAKRLRPFVLRRLKTEVAKELPPKTEIIRRVTLADDQRDLYEAVRHVMNDKVREEIAAKGIARSQIVILDALLKLRQTCCDPRLVKLEAARKVKESAKLEELMEMLPTLIEEGRKILLFSQFTSMLDLIKPALEKAEIPFVELRGTTKDRATPVKQFQRGDVPLFLISLKAGGTGLNLTAADTVIHYDPWWNPSVENQATDRAHRIGQDKPVFVYKLIAEGTVEERILELQGKKAGLAAALFGDKPGAAAKLTPDDLQWLMG